MDEAAVQERVTMILKRLFHREFDYQASRYEVALCRAAYAEGQRDERERAIKAVSDVQPKGAPGLMGELTWTAWEMCERIVAKIRQTAGEAK